MGSSKAHALKLGSDKPPLIPKEPLVRRAGQEGGYTRKWTTGAEEQHHYENEGRNTGGETNGWVTHSPNKLIGQATRVLDMNSLNMMGQVHGLGSKRQRSILSCAK
jgi:hypothetical protein